MKNLPPLFAIAIVLSSTPTLAQTPSPEVESASGARRICRSTPPGAEPECELIPFSEAVQIGSTLLPAAVEDAYERGYGTVLITLRTTGGSRQYAQCSGFLIDTARRLVATALHCLPDHIELLHPGNITFRNRPAQFVGRIREADLALFQIDRVPEGMRALPYREAVVSETVYARSEQTNPTTDQADSINVGVETFYMGPVTIQATVAAKGFWGVGETSSGRENQDPSSEIRRTQYQMIRLDGYIEHGFSGGPVFNRWGEVVGVLSRVAGGVTYAASARDFPQLLALYRDP